MLTEEEWQVVSPHLGNAIEQIKRYREEHGCSLAEATAKGLGQRALEMYEEITGFKETNPNALFHHRLSMYGPPCHVCGKPLRTPQARYCAMCSAERAPSAEGHA
jgi:ATP phosphoribosyltransferase regulatory subunit HisZ